MMYKRSAPCSAVCMHALIEAVEVLNLFDFEVKQISRALVNEYTNIIQGI